MKCVTLSPILPKMVKLGRLGRKSGQGFYDYPDPRRDRSWNDDVMTLIGGYRDQTQAPLEIDSNQISMQILSAIVLEATNILQDEIVADYRDIDLCIIHGISFPQHQGGILFWADQVGIEQVKRTLYRIGETEPQMEPNAMIKAIANAKGKFYR